MYTTRDYLDTLIMQLNLVPFATNGTYGHDDGWNKILMCRMKKSLISCKCSCSIVAKIIRASCKWQLITCSCKCIGCILGDFF